MPDIDWEQLKREMSEIGGGTATSKLATTVYRARLGVAYRANSIEGTMLSPITICSTIIFPGEPPTTTAPPAEETPPPSSAQEFLARKRQAAQQARQRQGRVKPWESAGKRFR